MENGNDRSQKFRILATPLSATSRGIRFTAAAVEGGIGGLDGMNKEGMRVSEDYYSISPYENGFSK